MPVRRFRIPYTHQLFRSAANPLAAQLEPLRTCDDSRAVADRLVDFVRQSEEQLAEGQRLPVSTEILESSFGLFKQLERQHGNTARVDLPACWQRLVPC